MSEAEMLILMDALDKGTNVFGPLKPEIRARLYAVVSDPTDSTWADTYTIMINNERFQTLWQACLKYAGYTGKPDGEGWSGWSEVPTRAQLLTALTVSLGR